MSQRKITVLIPVYNEEGSIPELQSSLVSVLKREKYSYSIIYLDDGSTDATPARLAEASRSDKNVSVVRFKRNFGKSAALTEGFRRAKGIVVTMDGDLQDDPEEIPHLLAKLDEGFDLVSGWKFKRRDPIGKTLPSKLFNLVLSSFSGVRIHDFNCGLKIYREAVYRNLDLYGSLYRFIPALAGKSGFRVTEIKVNHHPRKYGKSKFGAARFLVGLFDFFTVAFLSRYFQSPLHFFGGWGLMAITAGLLLDGYVLYLRILTGTIQNRLPLFLGGIFLMIVGFQSISLGLIGELITKTAAKKSRYVVDEDAESAPKA
jgi:glycosyltransferase involved in cell wall biosynthesis